MPTNHYFNLFHSKEDQRLYADLVNESVKIHGIDALYMIRESLSKFDPIFGDDPTKMFRQAYPVEVYVQTVDEFEGGELFSKFGLEIRKQARFLITFRAMRKAIPNYGRPKEGDILWLRNFQAFLEIKYVEDESMFYVFGENNTQAGLYGFSLVCEKWIAAEEVVSTGIVDLDTKADEFVTSYQFNMSNANTQGTFNIGELVTQGNTANATVLSWNKPNLILTLKHIHGVFQNNNVAIVGQNSNAHYFLASSNTRDDVNQVLDNNSQLAQQADQVLDFSEENPFGEPQS